MTDVMAGIRILEVAEHTFVPAASAILADWGAEVIKVEHVERGDAMRGLASTGVMKLGGNVHVLLEHSNRGKLSIGLDLSRPEGVEILYKIAATCDVFLTNKAPSVRKKLRIDVDDLRAHNPKIIYARGTAYGPRGPDADQGGYDMTGYWCRSGNASGAQRPTDDYVPIQPAPGYGDSIGAMFIAGGIATALLHRERTGIADELDVSLLGAGVWSMSGAIAISAQLNMPWRQPVQGKGGFGNPIVGNFRTADDRWLNLTMLQAFKYWPEVCRVIERPELVADPRFNSHEGLTQNAAEAQEIVAAEIAKYTLAEWRARLVGFQGQWTAVQDTLEVIEDEQVKANRYVMETATADGTPYLMTTAPVQFNGEAAKPKRAPEFNEHGDAILERAGIDWDTIVDLKMKGIVA